MQSQSLKTVLFFIVSSCNANQAALLSDFPLTVSPGPRQLPSCNSAMAGSAFKSQGWQRELTTVPNCLRPKWHCRFCSQSFGPCRGGGKTPRAISATKELCLLTRVRVLVYFSTVIQKAVWKRWQAGLEMGCRERRKGWRKRCSKEEKMPERGIKFCRPLAL